MRPQKTNGSLPKAPMSDSEEAQKGDFQYIGGNLEQERSSAWIDGGADPITPSIGVRAIYGEPQRNEKATIV